MRPLGSRQSVRTNNDVEGWHFCLNHAARRGQLPFYVLVPLLHRESQLVSLQARFVMKEKLRRHQRKRYVKLQGRPRFFIFGSVTRERRSASPRCFVSAATSMPQQFRHCDILLKVLRFSLLFDNLYHFLN